MGWLGSFGNGLMNSLGLSTSNERSAKSDFNATNYMAQDQLKKNYEAANQKLDTAYSSAKNKFQTDPAAIQSRQDIYRMVQGKGGYSDDTLNKMKGNTIEQAGTSLRNAQNTLNDRYGDASGRGMTMENLARAANTIDAQKADALRGIDINNAQLQEQEKMQAIPMAFKDAADIGNYDINNALASAGLTTEQAKAIAEMMSNQASSNLQVNSQKNLIQSLWGS